MLECSANSTFITQVMLYTHTHTHTHTHSQHYLHHAYYADHFYGGQVDAHVFQEDACSKKKSKKNQKKNQKTINVAMRASGVIIAD